jgi:hypothetical protein
MISPIAWEWFYYGRTAAELVLLVWAMILITRSRNQMTRMKAIIDEQDKLIADLNVSTERKTEKEATVDESSDNHQAKSHGLQKILDYKGLQPFLDQREWEALGGRLGIGQNELTRTWGVEIEDTFYLLALTYRNVDSVILLEESISRLSETPSVDCIVLFNNGERICIEVKATQQDKWKITQGRLVRQESLALKMGMKLYYAVFIGGYWTILSSAQVRDNGFEISFPDSLQSSLFNQLFNPRLIRIPKGLVIRNYYSLSQGEQAIGVEHPTYGFPIKYELDYFGVIVCLSDPMDLMSIAGVESGLRNQSIVKVDDDIHIATKEADHVLDVYDYNIFLAPIYSTVGAVSGQHYSSTTFISAALDMLKRGEKIGFLEAIDKGMALVLELASKGIPFEILPWSEVQEWKFLK